MAFLEDLKITGSLGNLSFYRMRGVDKIVVRQKGGASREYIKNSPTFATARLHMSEFGGCSKMGKEVRFMMHPVRNLADYNFSGFINKALKIVQKQDHTGELGRRSIMLSRHTSLLAGFQLNKSTTFDAVVRTPLGYTVNRETLSARVDIPALLRDINFHPNNRHARFRFEVSLGIVPDFTFDATDKIYKPPVWYTATFTPRSVSSPWYPALKGSPATSMEITLADQAPPNDGYSLMLTVGVRYGSPMEDDVVKEVKRAGVGKVIAVAGQPGGDASTGKPLVEDRPAAEPKRQELKQSTTPRQAAAACTYGWRCTTSAHAVEASSSSGRPLNAETGTPLQPKTDSLPEEPEEQPATNVSYVRPGNDATNDSSIPSPAQTTLIDRHHSPTYFFNLSASSAEGSKKDRSVDSTDLQADTP